MNELLFQGVDSDKNGSIDRTEIQNACSALGIELNHDEIEAIFYEYGDGREIRYQKFVTLLKSSHSQKPTDTAPKGPLSPTAQRREQIRGDVILKFKERLLHASGAGDGAVNFRLVFEECDKDRSGSIDRHEISEACDSLGIKLNHDEIDFIIDEYGDGNEMKYLSFVSFLE